MNHGLLDPTARNYLDRWDRMTSIEKVQEFLKATGFSKVHHPQGRSYIEIVTDPEGPEPKKEVWVKR